MTDIKTRHNSRHAIIAGKGFQAFLCHENVYLSGEKAARFSATSHGEETLAAIYNSKSIIYVVKVSK